MRLADGTLWPLPVTLPVTPGDGVAEGKPLALRDVYGNLLAFLHVEEIYAYDKEDEAKNAYGSTDAKHPSVAHLEPAARPLRLGPARGDPRAAALRLRRAPPHPGRAPRPLPVAGLEQDRRLPDPQPPAPGPRGADQARRRADRRRPADPPGRRRDQAGRRGPLHPGPLLSGPGRQLLRAGDRWCSACCRWPCAWPARARCCCTRSSAATTAAPTSSSAATTPGPGNDSTGKPFYSPYAAQESMGQHAGRDRHGDGRLQADGLPARRGPLQPGGRGPAGRQDGRHLRHRRSATTTWPRGSSSPSGSAGRPWPRSSTRPTRPSSARA